MAAAVEEHPPPEAEDLDAIHPRRPDLQALQDQLNVLVPRLA